LISFKINCFSRTNIQILFLLKAYTYYILNSINIYICSLLNTISSIRGGGYYMTQAPFHRCMECDEVITNPICTDCLASSMRASLAPTHPRLANKIHSFPLDGQTQCVLCRNPMALCAHCFSKDIYQFLEEKHPQLAKEFLTNFDFDLRRELVMGQI